MTEIIENKRIILTSYPENGVNDSHFKNEPCEYPDELQDG